MKVEYEISVQRYASGIGWIDVFVPLPDAVYREAIEDINHGRFTRVYINGPRTMRWVARRVVKIPRAAVETDDGQPRVQFPSLGVKANLSQEDEAREMLKRMGIQDEDGMVKGSAVRPEGDEQ